MRAPKRGKRYDAIVKAGCGGHWHHGVDGSDFDCDHAYEWDCDDCPVNDAIRKEAAKKDANALPCRLPEEP